MAHARFAIFTARSAACCVSIALNAMTSASPPAIDFNRDIRPILSDRCFGCHGPDAATRKAGLRLDSLEGASALLESGVRAVVAGDCGASELVRRINAQDAEEIMPPPKLKRPLSDDERALLLRWIESGARYDRHWAFVAPRNEPAATETADAWIRDPLDAHVLAQLKQLGLSPRAEAAREVLLRRATLAITGLNPTPEEIDAFTNDASHDAYETRVDALLASKRAAEHMAVAWLDSARYADTFGYQSDGDSFTWPWRDWLLNALDANTRYDELGSAMIAGDLLPNARVEDQVASAFNRLHRMTEEGGSICEEFRQEAIADRVSTFGTTFLGLTLECARCHDHKYDPIPTREFYGLAAMFGSIDENGLKPYVVPTSAPPPFVRLSSEAQRSRAAELTAALEHARAQLALDESAAAAAFDARERDPDTSLPAASARYNFESLADGATPNDVDSTKPATTDRKRPEQLGAVTLGDGHTGSAAHFDGDGGFSLTGLDHFTRHDAVTFAFWIRPSEVNARAALLHASGFYTNDADASGLELLIEHGRLRWSVIHLWPSSAASVEMSEPLPLGTWTHITATYDGSSSASGLKLYVNGRATTTRTRRDTLDGPITGHTLELGSRSRDAGFRGGAIDELVVFRRALTAIEAARAADVAADTNDLRTHAIAYATASARDSVRTAQRELAAHLDSIPSFMCMRDSLDAPPTFVLTRGAYDRPDHAQPVTAGALDAVLPFESRFERNRLGLAKWLFDARNPLAARVAVNRIWTQLFGRGLVATNENFGVQGAWPTHRAVLDLLAHDFANGDAQGQHAWDVKALLRRIVLSATFRQSSTGTSEERERDPANDELARGPSQRLSAEMLRDCALAAAGLLVERFGGPSVKPYQQASLASEAGQTSGYQVDGGEGAHRRSVYTYRKRTVPPPSMLTFDAGSREACQVRRAATNTPLQALVLLNDPIFVECARELAARVMREVNDDAREPAALRDARITRAFRLACARSIREAELTALRELVAQQCGDTQAHAASDAARSAELEALALACSTIFASDAFVVSR